MGGQRKFEVVFVEPGGLEGRQVVEAAAEAVAVQLVRSRVPTGAKVLAVRRLDDHPPPPPPPPPPLPPPPPPVPSGDRAGFPEVDRLLRGMYGMQRSHDEDSWTIASGVAKGVLTALAFMFYAAGAVLAVLGTLVLIAGTAAPNTPRGWQGTDVAVNAASAVFVPAAVLLIEGVALSIVGSMARSAMVRRAKRAAAEVSDR